VVPLHGLGTTVILIHGDPHPGGVSHLSQWFVHTGERDACNRCQKVFEQGLDADYAHSTASQTTLEILSTRKVSSGQLDTSARSFLSRGNRPCRRLMHSAKQLFIIYLVLDG